MAEQGAQKVINGVTYEFINGQWRIKLKPKAQEPSGQIVIKRDPRVILKGVDGAPVPNTYFGTDKYGIPKYLPIQEFIKKIITEVPDQIQSDWGEEDESSLAYIKNKPELHERAHDLEDELDHSPVNGNRKGKWLRTHPLSGIPLLTQNVHTGETPPDAIEGDLWYDISETEEGAIGYGSKYSATHEGRLKQMSIDDDYLYICVTAGPPGAARWKRVALNYV